MTPQGSPDAPAARPQSGGRDHAQDMVLITGGVRGIGLHLSRAFAEAGYAVVLTATAADRAAQAAAQLAAETGAAVFGAGVDVIDSASVRDLAATVGELEARAGASLRVVINNAGRIESTEGPVWDADPESLAAVIATNVTGPLLVVNALAPRLLEVAAATGRPTRIIDLNSGSGARGTNEYAAYSASKAALFRLADSVHHYGYPKGLRIFEMAPGVIESDMTHSMPLHDDRADWTSPQELTALALGLASGDLDEFSGRYVRAGADTMESLKALAPQLTPNTRRAVVDM